MSVNNVLKKQYRDKINQVYNDFADFTTPQSGWLKMVRTAMGMNGTQLANRLGVTKARVSKAEQDELTSSLTLKTMHNMASAMNCRFVYAVVPNDKIEEVIKQQANKKAREQVHRASIQMALESQSLNEKQIEFAIDELTSTIIKKMPSDLWKDK